MPHERSKEENDALRHLENQEFPEAGSPPPPPPPPPDSELPPWPDDVPKPDESANKPVEVEPEQAKQESELPPWPDTTKKPESDNELEDEKPPEPAAQPSELPPWPDQSSRQAASSGGGLFGEPTGRGFYDKREPGDTLELPPDASTVTAERERSDPSIVREVGQENASENVPELLREIIRLINDLPDRLADRFQVNG